jgi:2-methylcitrate dehydratase PrpD
MDIDQKSVAKALSIAWFDAIALAAKSQGGERATALEMAQAHSRMIAQLTATVGADLAQTPAA